jgi:hypothetical protein
MKVGICLVFFLTVLTLAPLALFADDMEIYQDTSLEPNVLILFDTSGSMLTILPATGRYTIFADQDSDLPP